MPGTSEKSGACFSSAPDIAYTFGDDRYDKAFAVNVRLFGAEATREADVLRRHLAPDGGLYLFQRHPSAARTHAVTDELRTGLERAGFTVRAITATGSGDAVTTCIVAGA